MDRTERACVSMVMYRIIILIAAAMSLNTVIGCLDCEPPSLPVTEENVVGIYIPSHSGTETLQVREDHTWLRSYYYPNGEVVKDSGEWRLSSDHFMAYTLYLSDVVHRHPDWLSSGTFKNIFSLNRPPQVPMGYHCTIRNDFGTIRFWWFADDQGMYHEKL